MRNLNQSGAIPLLLLLPVIGVITFVFIVSSASFDKGLFSRLYPKQSSYAASDPIYGEVPPVSGPITPRPSPTPSSTCAPRPTCLDAKPACLRNEPIEGWCPALNSNPRKLKNQKINN